MGKKARLEGQAGFKWLRTASNNSTSFKCSNETSGTIKSEGILTKYNTTRVSNVFSSTYTFQGCVRSISSCFTADYLVCDTECYQLVRRTYAAATEIQSLLFFAFFRHFKYLRLALGTPFLYAMTHFPELSWLFSYLAKIYHLLICKSCP
jgi:hypothetical protein